MNWQAWIISILGASAALYALLCLGISIYEEFRYNEDKEVTVVVSTMIILGGLAWLITEARWY